MHPTVAIVGPTAAGKTGLAFTIQELLVLLGETVARITGLEEVEQALDSLVSRGIVEAKELEGQRWYTAMEQGERRLGFLRE